MRVQKPLSKEEISVALLLAGAPEPQEVKPLPYFGSRHYLVAFESGAKWIVEELPSRAAEGVDHLKTIARIGAQHPSLAVGAAGQILTEGLDGCAWTFPMPKGQHGATMPADQVIPLIGQALRQIHEIPQAGRGTLPAETTFIGRSATWSEELLRLANQKATRARDNGAPFRTLIQELMDCIRGQRAALDAPSPAVIVHGALGPQNIWFDDTGQCTQINGWQRACFGDVEQDWAPFFFTPHFHHFVRGYGQESIIAKLAEPEFMGRLHAHLALYLIGRIGRIVELPLSQAQCLRTEQVHRMVSLFLTPGWVADRFNAVLTSDATPNLPAICPRRALSRWTLQGLALRSQSDVAPLIVGALGAIELAEAFPELSSGLLAVAQQACQRLPNQGPTYAVEDERSIRGQMGHFAEQILAELESSERIWGQAAAAFWMIDKALLRLEDQIESRMFCAIEEHLRLLIHSRMRMTQAMQNPEKNMTHRQNVFHGLLCLGGLNAIAAHLTSDDAARRIRDQRHRIQTIVKAAANGLQLPNLIQETGKQPLTATVSRLTLVEGFQNTQWALPALLAAFNGLDETWADIIPPEALFVLLDVKV